MHPCLPQHASVDSTCVLSVQVSANRTWNDRLPSLIRATPRVHVSAISLRCVFSNLARASAIPILGRYLSPPRVRVRYDCAGVVQEICEPIFDSVKPPFMNKLGFRKLQFGDAPIRIEAVRMNRERKEGVFLEMDFRWAGDPDIQLFVDALGGCAPAMHAAW